MPGRAGGSELPKRAPEALGKPSACRGHPVCSQQSLWSSGLHLGQLGPDTWDNDGSRGTPTPGFGNTARNTSPRPGTCSVCVNLLPPRTITFDHLLHLLLATAGDTSLTRAPTTPTEDDKRAQDSVPLFPRKHGKLVSDERVLAPNRLAAAALPAAVLEPSLIAPGRGQTGGGSYVSPPQQPRDFLGSPGVSP